MKLGSYYSSLITGRNCLIISSCVFQFRGLKYFVKLEKYNHLSRRMLSAQKSLCMETLNPAIKKVEYAVRGPIPIRANEIIQDMAKGNHEYPFKKIIKANIGDCHATGGHFITFVRQVLSVCTCPSLLNSKEFPEDVKDRARKILSNCGPGQSLGSYSESVGIHCLRVDAAEYIGRRDGIPASFENIFACCGASDGIRTILKMLIADPDSGVKSGVMIPIPQYPLYSAVLAEYGLHQIEYHLNESQGWSISIDTLKKAYDESCKLCKPRAIVVINPGNPTGQLIDEDNIEQVVRFAKDRNLVVLADEVYQDNAYDPNHPFVSFRKVVLSMPEPYRSTELASFHSASKGFMGECGARGGYFEVNNFDSQILVQLKKLMSTNLCPPVWGQVIMDLIISPPREGDPSYAQFMMEKKRNLDELKKKAQLVNSLLNKIDGIRCNPILGAMYAFPRITLPDKFIKMCQKEGKAPDSVYCMRLLESTGICVVPGSGFGQEPGTYHFRMTILPALNEIETLLEKLKVFHFNLMKEYSA